MTITDTTRTLRRLRGILATAEDLVGEYREASVVELAAMQRLRAAIEDARRVVVYCDRKRHEVAK